MRVIRYPARKSWPALLERPEGDALALEKKVAAILDDVRRQGDKALRKYAARFDGVTLKAIRVTENELTEARKKVPAGLKKAIAVARTNITRFHLQQREKMKIVETMPGVKCWRRSVPVEKVGLYIPGGSAPLFSTVLMLGIPAAIAGCSEVVVCTPCDANGRVNPVILYAARLVGITRIYKIGGAQAIAAMAFGTQTVPKVYKLFGPGNRYVTMAKQLVSRSGVAIDMPAGPSEVAVLADATAVPAFVAADLLSQAEHGPESQVMLVTDSAAVIGRVIREIEKQLRVLPRKDIIRQALRSARAVLVRNRSEAIALINEYAPEHLIIASTRYRSLVPGIINAGSVFLGNYSPESAGDYASGTNHTLPTNGYARSYSGVSLDSFVKKITFQELSRKGLSRIGPSVAVMAEEEGLLAHKRAVTIRLEKNV
ncbi:MAG: histidinol dehydrogenase [Bacteroidota bacterium]